MRLLKHPRLIRQEPFSYTAMASVHGHLKTKAKSCPASPAHHHTHLYRWQRQRGQLHPWTGQRSSQKKIAGHYHNNSASTPSPQVKGPHSISNQNAAKVGSSQKKNNYTWAFIKESLPCCAKSLQSCLTLCDPTDCSPPAFRLLQVTMPSSRRFS